MKVETMTVDLICKVTFDFSLSFWQAIKLRIAGKAFKPIAEKLMEEMIAKIRAEAEKKED